MEKVRMGDLDISIPESEDRPAEANSPDPVSEALMDEVITSGPGSGTVPETGPETSPQTTDYLPDTAIDFDSSGMKEVTMPGFQGDPQALNKLVEDIQSWLKSLDPKLLFLLFNIGLFGANKGPSKE